MDAFLPSVGGWEDVCNRPDSWHLRCHGRNDSPRTRRARFLRPYAGGLNESCRGSGGGTSERDDAVPGELL